MTVAFRKSQPMKYGFPGLGKKPFGLRSFKCDRPKGFQENDGCGQCVKLGEILCESLFFLSKDMHELWPVCIVVT